jgi:hypothetical protein
MQRQFLCDRSQWVLPHNHVDRPIRAHQQQPGGLPPPRQPGEQINRRHIAPMQVFQHQDERLYSRQGFERLSDLA